MAVGRRSRGAKALAPLDFEIWYFPIYFFVEKILFSVTFELVKWNFTMGGLPRKMFLTATWKNPLLTPWKKSIRRAWKHLRYVFDFIYFSRNFYHTSDEKLKNKLEL